MASTWGNKLATGVAGHEATSWTIWSSKRRHYKEEAKRQHPSKHRADWSTTSR